jgi:hypothetical protein
LRSGWYVGKVNTPTFTSIDRIKGLFPFSNQSAIVERWIEIFVLKCINAGVV